MPQLDSSKADFLRRLAEIEAKFTTRKEAAQAAGIAQSTFQNWATGKAVPNFQGMANLARASGVSLDWLAFGTGQAPDGSMAPSAAQCEADSALMSEIYVKIHTLVQDHGQRLSPEQHIAFTCDVYNKVMAKPDDREEIVSSALGLMATMLKGLMPAEPAEQTPTTKRRA